MAVSKDNLALFGIKTQSCWLCMSVVLTLGVSSAGTWQGREEDEPYLTEGRRTRSLPVPTHLSHTCNYFPTTYTVSPSFLSTPSMDFGGGHSQQHSRVPTLLVRTSRQPRTASPAKGTPEPHSIHPYSTTCQRGTPRNVPLGTLALGNVLGSTFTLPSLNDRQREVSKQHRLTLPIQKIPLHLAHCTTRRALP